MFNFDTVISEDAYMYRYAVAKLKLDSFSNTKIIHREFGAYDKYLAYVPGNSEPKEINSEQGVVTNCNGLYFYIWSDKQISDRKLKSTFLKAIQQYYNNKINDLMVKSDTYKMRLNSVENELSN